MADTSLHAKTTTRNLVTRVNAQGGCSRIKRIPSQSGFRYFLGCFCSLSNLLFSFVASFLFKVHFCSIVATSCWFCCIICWFCCSDRTVFEESRQQFVQLSPWVASKTLNVGRFVVHLGRLADQISAEGVLATMECALPEQVSTAFHWRGQNALNIFAALQPQSWLLEHPKCA